MTSRLKKLNRSDIGNRMRAIVFIDGEIIEGYTHAECIDDYLKEHYSNYLYDNRARPYKYESNSSYIPDENDIRDINIIEENIKQMAFAHKFKDYISIEADTLQNVDVNTVVNAIKEKYPDFYIYDDITNEKIARLKKLNRRDMDDRDSAITYIDGEVIEDETHAGCINYYLQMYKNNNGLNDTFARPPKYDNYKNYTLKGKDKEDQDIIEENIKQLAFAHKCEEDNSIYIEEFSLQNVDINTVAKVIKEQFPSFNIYIEETNEKIARLKKKKMQKTANYISQDFDSFFLDSGDVIAIGCRLVNDKPRYQVYQEGLYCSSSYYDGDDYNKALQMYKDLMTAFDGIGKTEGFAQSEVKIKENIESLIKEKKDDEYNFDRLKSDPLFLGVNRNDW